MFDEDAPETPGVSSRSNAAKPRRKKSARAQRHAARKKGRAGVTTPAADAASPAAGVPNAAAAVSEAPLQNNAPAEPVAAAASPQDEPRVRRRQPWRAPPPDAATIETPNDPEAVALALWEEGRRQEAVELLEREIAMERVRAGVRVLTPVEAGMGSDESVPQPDATPVEPADHGAGLDNPRRQAP